MPHVHAFRRFKPAVIDVLVASADIRRHGGRSEPSPWDSLDRGAFVPTEVFDARLDRRQQLRKPIESNLCVPKTSSELMT
jgi:hypothetical protein